MYGKPPKGAKGCSRTKYLWTASPSPVNPRRRRASKSAAGKRRRRLSSKSLFLHALEGDLTEILLQSPSLREHDDPTAAWKATLRGHAPFGYADILSARLRLGMMLINLEREIDHPVIRKKDGTVCGRSFGLKGWIRQNCPGLLPHYKSLMAYKTVSEKLCTALGVRGSMPLSEKDRVQRAFRDLFEQGVPRTWGALEVAIRLKLGLVWMRRLRLRNPVKP